MTENKGKITDPREREEPDPYGLDRPPSTRAEMEEFNRRTRERLSDERTAREVATAAIGIQAAQEAKAALYGPTGSDGLAIGQQRPAPTLPDGELGDAVRELVKLERIEGGRSRALARVTVEQAERDADERALRPTVDVLAAAALTAGAKRETVPPTWAPLVELAIEHRTAELAPTAKLDRMIREAIDEQTIEAAQTAVRDALEGIDGHVLTGARRALQQAVQAAERLELSGVTVDLTLSDAIDRADDGVLSTLRLWRGACSQWEAVQSVRAWVAAAQVRGFALREGSLQVAPPPRIPSGAHARTENIERAQALADVEVHTQGSPWLGVRMPLALRQGSAHAVLRWYVQREEVNRPGPCGVIEHAE